MLERPIFPNQVFVSRLMSSNETWAEENQTNLPIHEDKRPLGLVEVEHPIVLAKHVAGREALARWVPPTLQTTKLELIYSSNVHGRCLETFYARLVYFFSDVRVKCLSRLTYSICLSLQMLVCYSYDNINGGT